MRHHQSTNSSHINIVDNDNLQFEEDEHFSAEMLAGVTTMTPLSPGQEADEEYDPDDLANEDIDNNATDFPLSPRTLPNDIRTNFVAFWLMKLYEPHETNSIPRSMVYETYLNGASEQSIEAVNAATFGKIIRAVFPTLRTRRLGTRGNSKYHYYGIIERGDNRSNNLGKIIPSGMETISGMGSASMGMSLSMERGSLGTGVGMGSIEETGMGIGGVDNDQTMLLSSNLIQAMRRLGSKGKRSLMDSPSDHPKRKNNSNHSISTIQNTILTKAESTPTIACSNINSGTGTRRKPSLSSTSHSHGHVNGMNGMGGGSILSNTHSSNYRILIPNYDEFAKLLEGICQFDFNALIGQHVSIEQMRSFSMTYQSHINQLLRLICEREFNTGAIESNLASFWKSINSPDQQHQNQHQSCLRTDEGLRLIANADDYLYQVVINTLTPDILESVPINITQTIRQFSKSFEMSLSQILLESSLPSQVIEVKMELARKCGQILRRRTCLVHLTQAVRSILGNPEHVNQMIHDWTHIDFYSIKEQCSWIIKAKDAFLGFVESNFKSYLLEGLPLPQWLHWIDTMLDQCISVEINTGEILEHAARSVILRWSFFSTMVLRDLTLRSASSFGSFHLVRLLFDEYILYYVERKLEEHKRAVGNIVNGNIMNTNWNSIANRIERDHGHGHIHTGHSISMSNGINNMKNSNNGNNIIASLISSSNDCSNSNSNLVNNSIGNNNNGNINNICLGSPSHSTINNQTVEGGEGGIESSILMSDDPRYMLFASNN